EVPLVEVHPARGRACRSSALARPQILAQPLELPADLVQLLLQLAQPLLAGFPRAVRFLGACLVPLALPHQLVEAVQGLGEASLAVLQPFALLGHLVHQLHDLVVVGAGRPRVHLDLVSALVTDQARLLCPAPAGRRRRRRCPAPPGRSAPAPPDGRSPAPGATALPRGASALPARAATTSSPCSLAGSCSTSASAAPPGPPRSPPRAEA